MEKLEVSANGSTPVSKLPKSFRAQVEIVNMRSVKKSMYITMEDGETYRVAVPSRINAEEIDGTTQDFIVRGVGSLELANKQQPKQATFDPQMLGIGDKFTDGSEILDIAATFGILLFKVFDISTKCEMVFTEDEITQHYEYENIPPIVKLIKERDSLYLHGATDQQFNEVNNKLLAALLDYYYETRS